MSEKIITVFRASDGYLYTQDDRTLIELFSSGSEGDAMGKLLNRVFNEFSTEGGFQLNVTDLVADRTPSEGHYLVYKKNGGFVVYSSNASYLCRNSADLHKLLGDKILEAAQTYIDGQGYTISIPTQSAE